MCLYINFNKCINAASQTLLQGQTIKDIPPAVLEDAGQLVKANSISGCKMNEVDVVYTMWSNLRKTPDMDVGQVGFHSDKEVGLSPD